MSRLFPKTSPNQLEAARQQRIYQANWDRTNTISPTIQGYTKMPQLLGQYKVQVYHKGKPAEQFDLYVDPRGNVAIEGPQWNGLGVLWLGPSRDSKPTYNGLAILHQHDDAIAYHDGWVDSQMTFHIKAIFPGGLVTMHLEWRLEPVISENTAEST